MLLQMLLVLPRAARVVGTPAVGTQVVPGAARATAATTLAVMLVGATAAEMQVETPAGEATRAGTRVAEVMQEEAATREAGTAAGVVAETWAEEATPEGAARQGQMGGVAVTPVAVLEEAETLAWGATLEEAGVLGEVKAALTAAAETEAPAVGAVEPLEERTPGMA